MDKKGKKVVVKLIAVIVMLIIISSIILLLADKKLISNLKGEVDLSGGITPTAEKTASDVCSSITGSEYFMVLNGSISQDLGNEGVAVLTFTDGNLSYTKELNVSSTSQTAFKYTLPIGTYTLTVTKDGYKTYEKTITKETTDNYLNIVLNNKTYKTLVAGGYYGVGIGYNYYSDGSLELKKMKMTMQNPYTYTILSDVVTTVLANAGYPLNFKTDTSTFEIKGKTYTIDWSGLQMIFTSLALSDTIGSNTMGERDRLIQLKSNIENGQCTDDDLNSSNCPESGLLIMWGGVDKALGGINTILNIPINNNIAIDNDINNLSIGDLPILMGCVTNDFVIPSNFTELSQYTFGDTKMRTFTIPGKYKKIPQSFAVFASINNLIIQDGIELIDDSAFASATITNITLPSTLKTIGKDAFQNTKINGIAIPEGVTTIGDEAFMGSTISEISLPSTLTNIGDSAFKGTKLTSITIPASVTSIGSSAFSDVPLTSVTIQGDSTRFNNIWSNIGFPDNLKPSK